jgi:hypothetical protein
VVEELFDVIGFAVLVVDVESVLVSVDERIKGVSDGLKKSQQLIQKTCLNSFRKLERAASLMGASPQTPEIF